ncbi:ABC transporter permease [Patulibacter brassicae]|uniref:ABC transporter permease n=1 Tax=Patulibacter brassicae TaxID=1705717 RepID=A0ABU4VPC0_9ACTN|nr:ABC transporter permease [Patulibacter brassicae]MDX8152615.1 ABC transporter permease [Patulibacter brassicae]
MARYIIRRLLWTVVTLVVITTVAYVLFRVLPSGDPVRARAGKAPTQDRLDAIRESLGLDNPWYQQLGDFLWNAAHFDFGRSYISDAELRPLLLDALGATVWLVVGAAILWLAVAAVVGTISALRRGSIPDRLAMGGALVAISAPVYWLGLVALYLFASDIGQFKVFPGAGSYADASNVLDRAWAMVLPWMVLAAAFSAIYARLLRSSMLETMSEDYIRTARAKGLTERRVVARHGARAAITPIVTALGVDVGFLIGGNAILTESVFNIPGLGRLSFDAIQRGDVATIQATVLFLAFFVCISALIVDLLYAVIDPRVKYE